MTENIDPKEIAQFDAIGDQWWDPNGPFKPLHQLNPIRLKFVVQHTDLKNKKLIDIGCGGGLFSEALAKDGATVTGIDMSPAAIKTATAHAQESKLAIDYQQVSAEQFAQQHPGEYQVISCMELLEHVPDPASLIKACADLAKPGADLFFSTINRNPKAYALAILGAEYLLGLLPRGTHDYSKFIRPSELDEWAQAAGLTLQNIAGFSYNPLTQQVKLTDNVSVNYLIHYRKLNA